MEANILKYIEILFFPFLNYDLQEIISFIIIFYLYSVTSIIGCGASQHTAIDLHCTLMVIAVSE